MTVFAAKISILSIQLLYKNCKTFLLPPDHEFRGASVQPRARSRQGRQEIELRFFFMI